MPTLKEITDIIDQLRYELSGKCQNPEYVDQWLFNSSEKISVPVYKRITLGYVQKDPDNYELIIKTFTKNSKTNRLANEIIEKIGTGKVERNLSGKGQFIFLDGNTVRNNNTVSLGSGIRKKFGNGGTLGAFVSDSDEKIHFLTCGHVMKNTLIKSDEVYLDCNKRFLSNDKCKKIGDLRKCHPPQKRSLNEIDAAIVSIHKLDDNCRNIILNSPHFNNEPIELIPEEYIINEGEDVYKIGAKVKFSKGKFEGILFDVDFKGYVFNKLYAINETIMPFSLAGDSGSIVFINQDSKLFAFGIVIGRGIVRISRRIYQTQIYVCPIHNILKECKLKFV